MSGAETVSAAERVAFEIVDPDAAAYFREHCKIAFGGHTESLLNNEGEVPKAWIDWLKPIGELLERIGWEGREPIRGALSPRVLGEVLYFAIGWLREDLVAHATVRAGRSHPARTTHDEPTTQRVLAALEAVAAKAPAETRERVEQA